MSRYLPEDRRRRCDLDLWPFEPQINDFPTEAVLAIRPGRPWPTQTRTWPTQTARVIPMIHTYTTPVDLPKICLAFDWPTQMKIPRTAPAFQDSSWNTHMCEVWCDLSCIGFWDMVSRNRQKAVNSLPTQLSPICVVDTECLCRHSVQT